MTREEWLQKAVEELNAKLFNGELDILNRPYQISTGRTRWDDLQEVFMPYKGEDVTMDDFFPPTIIISHLIKDPVDLMAAVALGCIQAFFDHQRCGKKFKKEAERYYFEFNKRVPVINDYLRSILLNAYGTMVKKYGDYPGKPVYIHKTDKRESGKKNSLTLFCPNCDFTLKVSRRVFEKHGSKCPTCVCGAHMAVDLSEEEESAE